MKSPPSIAAMTRRAVAATVLSIIAASLLGPTPAFAARVFLDPGHGGRYPGATYAGVEEQYVNMLVVTEARKILEARGHTVKQSRYGDATVCTWDIPTWHYSDAQDQYYLYADGKTGVYSYGDGSAIAYDDLQRRCDLANGFGADIFLSIHNNAGGTASGTETFYNSWSDVTDTALSRRLATYVQEEVVRSAGTTSRRVDDVGYYVIRWSNMPAALVEVAFLSNPTERAKLLSPAFRTKVAIGIANGVDRFVASEPFAAREPRIEGSDRYRTSANAALTTWSTGADTVVLASGENWADALAAAPLSTALDAPVLLTPQAGLAAPAASALATLRPDTVVVLGGESAVASSVASEAAAAAGLPESAVRRIAGADRYDTAVLIAEEIGTSSGAVTIVSSEAYADAVSASAFSGMLGRPILLTKQAGLSPEVGAYLAAHSDAITGAVVIGGPAVVSEGTVAALRSRVPATWLWGSDRYATNVKTLEYFWPAGAIAPTVATANDFPDALTAGVLAANNGQPLMLCGRSFLAGRTREWIMHETDRIGAFTMVGGTGVLSNTLEWEFAKARRFAQ
ncbi:MAG: cell wall-binding repeat-containing protein [Coriobacteriia bacterium]